MCIIVFKVTISRALPPKDSLAKYSKKTQSFYDLNVYNCGTCKVTIFCVLYSTDSLAINYQLHGSGLLAHWICGHHSGKLCSCISKGTVDQGILHSYRYCKLVDFSKETGITVLDGDTQIDISSCISSWLISKL